MGVVDGRRHWLITLMESHWLVIVLLKVWSGPIQHGPETVRFGYGLARLLNGLV